VKVLNSYDQISKEENGKQL
jgi:hypothetical protein